MKRETRTLDEIIIELTNGLAKRSLGGPVISTYRIGLSGAYAVVDRIDRKIKICSYYTHLSREKALREFVYSLEGTKLFNTKTLRMVDEINELGATATKHGEYKIEVLQSEEEDIVEMALTIIVDEIENDGETVGVLYSGIEEEIEEDEDEEELTGEEIEEDEDDDCYIYEWSLEIKDKENSTTHHPTLESLIIYALENEKCIEKGVYVAKLNGNSYMLAQEITRTLNKILKDISSKRR